MINFIGELLATFGAGFLIFALVFVTLLLTALIFAMFGFIASPLLDRVFKEG